MVLPLAADGIDMLATGVISEFKEIRWDIRPSPELGPIEVRVCDGLPTLDEVAAISTLTHCLVVDLDRRLEAGETLPTLPPWHVQENKWRAARLGCSAGLVSVADLMAAERATSGSGRWPLERAATYGRSSTAFRGSAGW